MPVYVGKDVNVKIQNAVKDEDETAKLIKRYNYASITQSETGSHEAYHHSAASEPNPPFGSELNDSEYNQIGTSDNTRFSRSTNVNGEYAMILFRYKPQFAEADVKKIIAKFEGYGTAPSGNGVTMKIWNHVSSVWEHEQTGTGDSDETLKITITSNIDDYIDNDGYIWILARTTNPSDGTTEAILYCDYAECYITRSKFRVDYTPISDRDLDGVADESEHVTVKVNSAEVTVSSVDDSTGEVVLASGDFNETDIITCDYRFDKEPYVAQELTLEPKQRIEGIDGLGSDTIQVWAPLLKEIDGSIKEVFKGEQLPERMAYIAAFRDEFNSESSLQNYELTGEWIISDGMIVPQSSPNKLRYPVKLRSGTVIETRVRVAGACARHIFLRSADGSRYFRIFAQAWNVNLYYYDGSSERLIDKYKLPSGYVDWWTLKIHLRSKGVKVICNDVGEVSGYADDGWIMPFDGFEYVDDNLSPRGLDFLYIIPPIPDDYGILVEYSRGGQTAKLGLNGVVFPEGSIPAPKNEPVYIVTPFKARSIRVIT
ncbi:MAG: hypothetical protein DRN88_03825 [Candidatus Hydrothermarchaeota archaeon]|nr:MAG: hypothetical protein DRN88_03825 [Candidatus Hydrothermarchaeota archaeon]